ncbi:protein FAM122A-like isoform X1 [Arapaima gigas]
MISGVSDGMMVFSPSSSARYRRSSVSVSLSSPVRGMPLCPFPLVIEKPDQKWQEESMELSLRGSIHELSQWYDHELLDICSLDSGVTPNSSPSSTRRFRGAAISQAVRWSSVTPLKRKGGTESDGPPKKLFVAGVTNSPHNIGYGVSSVSQSVCPCPREASMSSGLLALSPPASSTSHHPSI